MKQFDKMDYFKSLVEASKKAQLQVNRIEEEEEERCENIDINLELAKQFKL